MSKVSALMGATAQGFAEVKELGLQGMVTLKADLSTPEVAKAVQAAAGLALPTQRGIVEGESGAVAWMARDELLILCGHDQADACVATLDSQLTGAHHLAVNVSDARAFFAIEGAGAREVLAKLAPVDLRPGVFEPGEMRRTRLAQVPAAFWMTGPNSFRLICFRSVARYVFDILAISAREGGAVGYYDL